MTKSFFGIRSSLTASSELIIIFPSRGHALTSTGADPVAITTFCALIVSSPPSLFATISVGDFKRGLRAHELHAVGFEECLDAVDVGAHDLVLELRHALALDFGLEPSVRSRPRARCDGRPRRRAAAPSSDAPPVQADAADLVPIEAENLLAQLTKPDRDVIAARSRANNDDVKLLLIAHTRGFA